MPKPPRIGVLTAGGDCPGLNAVIRAVVKSLIVHSNAEVVGFEDGYLGLMRRRHRPLTMLDASGILTRGGTILGSSNLGNPFRDSERGNADVSADVCNYYNELGLDGLVVIGGDGSMSIAHGLQQCGMRMVGVPKTIDNDLMATERTFGFDTAVSIATEAIDRLHTTAQSHRRVMILETMGRYAGWIALHAGVASGADIILIPEYEYEIDEIARVCRERADGGQRFTIIVVAEGAKPRGGEVSVRERIAESTDPLRLGGIGIQLERELKDRLHVEVRTSVLGHIQRGGTPTPFDRTFATALGSYAAALISDQQFGRMVAVQQNRLTSVPLETVANRTRTVPPDNPIVAAALGVGTSFGVKDLEYVLTGTSMSNTVM